MHWFTGILVFVITWWMVFFAVLPFGLQRDETGKPEIPNLWRKLLVTTGIALGIFLIIFLIVDSGFVSFREMVAADAD